MRFTTESSEPTPIQVRVTTDDGGCAKLKVQVKDGHWSTVVTLMENGTIYRSMLYEGDLQLGLRASSDGRIEVSNPAPYEQKTGALTEEEKR